MSGTTGTVRTVSFLLNFEFEGGQPDGSISSQDMRDLVVTLVSLCTTNAAITGGTISGTTFASNVRTVTAAGAVTMTSTDNVVALNKTVGQATAVTLPSSPVPGMNVSVKDLKGDSATNTITISPASGLIDNASSVVLSTAFSSIDFVYTGSGWIIV